ncbi:hypothetical protein AB0F17_36085 [Nonomuraea sp. NPDC026600]|uniref:hypothetical protein n=1 Tax=Nonomuraea sp. NPDC026600 TaxID=3155363 RepID=UPI0033F2F270
MVVVVVVGVGLGLTVLVVVGVGLGLMVLVVVGLGVAVLVDVDVGVGVAVVTDGLGVGKDSAAAKPAVPNAIPPPAAIATKIGIVIFSLISDSPYGWRCGSWDISPGIPAKCSSQNPLYAPY